MERIIGIDFGTSTTYMYVKRYDGQKPDGTESTYLPVVFGNGASNGVVASIVRENADGTFDFGEKAAEELEGARIYREIKMRLESADEEERAQARRTTEEFFKFLYATYNQQRATLGDINDEEETIVSYPVKWQPETVEFMCKAAENAGFKNVRGMDEATAAVFAMLNQNADGKLISANAGGYLMLVDMGAGTTDLVVCKYTADAGGKIDVEMVTSWPQSADEPTFGGREIDAVLENYVEAYLKQALKPEMKGSAHTLATTAGAAKNWKEKDVSDSLCANKTVNTCGYLSNYKAIGFIVGEFPAFGREKFEEMTKSGLEDYAKLLKGCLDNAAENDDGVKSKGLDFVILTGGHSAWYFARDILDGTMGGYLDHTALARIREEKGRVFRLPNPQSTVSLGLVYSRLPFTPIPIPKPIDDTVIIHPDDDDRTYTWDNRLVDVIKDFLSKSAYFANTNAVDKSDSQQVCAYFNIGESQKLLYVKSGTEVAQETQLALTDAGIYAQHGADRSSQRFMSWFGLMNSRPEEQSGQVRIYGGGVILQLSGEEAASFIALRKQLRDAAAELKPIEPIKPDEQVKPNDGVIVVPKPTPTIGGVPKANYNSSICPECGTPIPAQKKKCQRCGRRKLPDPVTPFKIDLVSWYKREAKIGIASATGRLTVTNDAIEFKKNFGNAAESVIPYYNIYATVKANLAPKEIFWLKDIVSLKESTYFTGYPSIVVSMNDGSVYTFVAPNASVASKDNMKCAMALLCSLWHKMHDNG